MSSEQIVVPHVMELNIHIGFHPKNVCCDGCWLCVTDAYNRDRKRCFVTNEIIYEAKSGVGLRCPLRPVEENKWKAGEF